MRSMMYGIQIRPVSVVVKTRYSSSVFITSSLSCHDDALRTALPPCKTRWITKRHLPGPVTRSMQIERVALQGFDGDVFEDVFVGGFEDDVRDAFRAVRGAAAVAEEAGERGVAARQQRAAENVLFLGEDGAHGRSGFYFS